MESSIKVEVVEVEIVAVEVVVVEAIVVVNSPLLVLSDQITSRALPNSVEPEAREWWYKIEGVDSTLRMVLRIAPYYKLFDQTSQCMNAFPYCRVLLFDGCIMFFELLICILSFFTST